MRFDDFRTTLIRFDRRAQYSGMPIRGPTGGPD